MFYGAMNFQICLFYYVILFIFWLNFMEYLLISIGISVAGEAVSEG